MNIFFFSDNYYPETNAAANRAHERARILVSQGHEVIVVTSCPNMPLGRPTHGYRNCWRSREVIEGITVVRVKTYITENTGILRRSLDYLSYLPLSIYYALKLPKPDIYIACSPHLLVPISGLITSKFKRVPLITEVADIWPDSVVGVGVTHNQSLLYKLLKLVEKAIYKSSVAVVALSDSINEHVRKVSGGAAAVKTIVNGVDRELFASVERDYALRTRLFGEGEGEGEGLCVLGYLGNFGPAQNIPKLIETFSQLDGDHYRLVLAGSGAEREKIIQTLDKLSDERVLLLDPLAREEVPSYWSICDIALVHLSTADVFKSVIPSKIFEIFALGLPVILSAPNGDASDLLDRHGAGVAVIPGDVVELLRAIKLCIENRELYSAAGKEASKIYTRKYQAEELASLAQDCLILRGD